MLFISTDVCPPVLASPNLGAKAQLSIWKSARGFQAPAPSRTAAANTITGPETGSSAIYQFGNFPTLTQVAAVSPTGVREVGPALPDRKVQLCQSREFGPALPDRKVRLCQSREVGPALLDRKVRLCQSPAMPEFFARWQQIQQRALEGCARFLMDQAVLDSKLPREAALSRGRGLPEGGVPYHLHARPP